MWAILPQKLQHRLEQSTFLKKTTIRIFTLSLTWSFVGVFAINDFLKKFPNILRLGELFTLWIIVLAAISLGALVSFFVFVNMIKQVRKIISELSKDKPNWPVLEKEYLESDLKILYLAIKKLHSDVSEQSKLSGVAQVASQVAHDIRSPLVVLDLLTRDLAALPEEQRLLVRNAVRRIHAIADNLLEQYKPKPETLKNAVAPQLIADLILTVLCEKEIQYQNKKINFVSYIEPAAYLGFAAISAVEFKRVLSNLCDNAVEALEQAQLKEIRIELGLNAEQMSLTISDTGCGIAPEILRKIVAGELITSKLQGHGLGLSHAIKTIEQNWQGKVTINSKLGEGSSFAISFPRSVAPPWFAGELVFKATSLVILDDDEAIHQIWRQKFSALNFKGEILDFYDPAQMLSVCAALPAQERLYLIDFELIGHELNGLAVIKQLNLVHNAYLVTSRYDDPEVQQQSLELGIKIIPKKIVSGLELRNLAAAPLVDLILLDDSPALARAWSMHGLMAGKIVVTFNSSADLRAQISQYPIQTPIYIDEDLGEELPGHQIARELYQQGFTNLFLTTGFSSDKFAHLPWLKGVLSKQPPF